MTTAGEVAKELRRLADALDNNPDSIIRKAQVFFSCDTKDQFVATVSVLPRPLRKRVEDDTRFETLNRVIVSQDSNSLYFEASVYKSLTCELVEPAKPAVYRCAPILSLEEEESLVSE